MSFLLSMTSARFSVALRGLALAALLAGCGESERIQGQVAVVGLAPDWQGYEARLLDANDHELQRTPVSDDGQFRFSYGSRRRVGRLRRDDLFDFRIGRASDSIGHPLYDSEMDRRSLFDLPWSEALARGRHP